MPIIDVNTVPIIIAWILLFAVISLVVMLKIDKINLKKHDKNNNRQVPETRKSHSKEKHQETLL